MLILTGNREDGFRRDPGEASGAARKRKAGAAGEVARPRKEGKKNLLTVPLSETTQVQRSHSVRVICVDRLLRARQETGRDSVVGRASRGRLEEAARRVG